MPGPVASYGVSVSIGGQVAISGFLVESDTGNEAEVDLAPDVENPDGLKVGRNVLGRYAKRTLLLTVLTGTDAAAVFPVGTLAPSTAGSFQSWWVESGPVPKTKNPTKVTVTLVSLGPSFN